MKKIGVLISGGGTNLQALIDKQGTVLKSGKIVCVYAQITVRRTVLNVQKMQVLRLKLSAKMPIAAVITTNLTDKFVRI